MLFLNNVYLNQMKCLRKVSIHILKPHQINLEMDCTDLSLDITCEVPEWTYNLEQNFGSKECSLRNDYCQTNNYRLNKGEYLNQQCWTWKYLMKAFKIRYVVIGILWSTLVVHQNRSYSLIQRYRLNLIVSTVSSGFQGHYGGARGSTENLPCSSLR